MKPMLLNALSATPNIEVPTATAIRASGTSATPAQIGMRRDKPSASPHAQIPVAAAPRNRANRARQYPMMMRVPSISAWLNRPLITAKCIPATTRYTRLAATRIAHAILMAMVRHRTLVAERRSSAEPMRSSPLASHRCKWLQSV